MSRECAVCRGSSHGFTVAENEEGVRVTVHAGPCATMLGERRQAAAQKEEIRLRQEGKFVPKKTIRARMWVAQWDENWDRYLGHLHKMPCACPKCGAYVEKVDADITWDTVVKEDPDAPYK